MKIEKNKVVAVTYDLTVDGKLADRATEDRPLDYIHGTHMLIPRFEAEVEGLEEGAEFTFAVTPEEGYGEYDEKMCFDVPRSAFTINGEIREDLMQVGRTVPMMGRDGNILQAVIVAVKPDGVTLDFNHPMAGKELHFAGKVLSVRDATEKELTEGLNGEYLPPEEGHHCCHGKGHCHGEGHHHGDGDCCHGGGHHGDGECCHGKGHCHHEE